jgi:hypothetical protein
MERGRDAVERRTELAVRYVAHVGLAEQPSLVRIHETVSNVLSDAAVNASPSIRRTETLKKALDEWLAAGGSDEGRKLIYRAQGVIGMINVSDRRDALWLRTMDELNQLKREWAAARPSNS